MSYLLTVEEAATMLRVDNTTIRGYIRDKLLRDVFGLPCKDKRRHTWRIPITSIAVMLETSEERLTPYLPESVINKPKQVGQEENVHAGLESLSVL